MQQLQLEDDEVETLLRVLDANSNATGKTDAIRWTSDAADRIGEVKQSIKTQT